MTRSVPIDASGSVALAEAIGTACEGEALELVLPAAAMVAHAAAMGLGMSRVRWLQFCAEMYDVGTIAWVASQARGAL